MVMLAAMIGKTSPHAGMINKYHRMHVNFSLEDKDTLLGAIPWWTGFLRPIVHHDCVVLKPCAEKQGYKFGLVRSKPTQTDIQNKVAVDQEGKVHRHWRVVFTEKACRQLINVPSFAMDYVEAHVGDGQIIVPFVPEELRKPAAKQCRGTRDEPEPDTSADLDTTGLEGLEMGRPSTCRSVGEVLSEPLPEPKLSVPQLLSDVNEGLERLHQVVASVQSVVQLDVYCDRNQETGQWSVRVGVWPEDK